MRPLKTIIQIIIISGAFSSWMWMAISFIESIYDDVPVNFLSIISFNLFYAAGIVDGVRIKRKNRIKQINKYKL